MQVKRKKENSEKELFSSPKTAPRGGFWFVIKNSTAADVDTVEEVWVSRVEGRIAWSDFF
jgi:hypothetical protein